MDGEEHLAQANGHEGCTKTIKGKQPRRVVASWEGAA